MFLLYLFFDVLFLLFDSNTDTRFICAIPWLPIALAGGSLVSGAMNWLGQKTANQTNIELAEKGQDFEREMWELNNDYNSPIKQMQRLKDAGLNPDMIYGGGSSGATGISSSFPKPHIATVNNELIGLAQVVPSIIGAYQDYRLKEAQIDNVKSNTDLNFKKDLILGTTKELKEIQLLNDKDYRNWYWGENGSGLLQDMEYKNAQTHKLTQDFRRSVWQMANLDPQLLNSRALDMGIKNLEFETNQGLRPYNLNMSDNIFAKLFAKLLELLK